MRRSLYILTGGFLAGVAWRSLFALPLTGVWMLLVLGGVLIVYAAMTRYTPALYVALAVLALVVGVVRTSIAYDTYTHIRDTVQEGFIISDAQVMTEPDVRDGYTFLTLALLDEQGGETELRVRTKVPLYPAYRYGEVLRVRGTLREPQSFTSDTGRHFDYAAYLMKEGVQYELATPVVTHTGVQRGNPIVKILLTIKHAWLASVSRLIPEPGAALAGGLVVGAKQSLGEQWITMFRTAGLIHIVVLSGYNLTLIASVIVWMCARLPRTIALTGGVLGVVGFACLAGLSATVVRASIMAVLTLVATYLHRPHAVSRLLALAALSMVAINPFVLVFDTGFQLSFVATLGLVYGAPLVSSFFTMITERWGMREIVAATIATQLAVLPILLYSIGNFSLVAPLVNVLVLPLIPSIMLLTFCAGVLGLFSGVIALPVAWAGHTLLSYVLWVVKVSSSVPYASISIPPVSVGSVVCMYVLMGLLWWYATHRAHKVSHGVSPPSM